VFLFVLFTGSICICSEAVIMAILNLLFGGPGMVTIRHPNGRDFSVMPVTYTAYCNDCNANIGAIGEWCLLKNSVWEKAWPGTGQKNTHTKMPMKHLLCIGCIEKRIGRRLKGRDFDMRSKANKAFDGIRRRKSQRMQNRLKAR
jgi:hypothetical protein